MVRTTALPEGLGIGLLKKASISVVAEAGIQQRAVKKA
jgi:hypothetical protein